MHRFADNDLKWRVATSGRIRHNCEHGNSNLVVRRQNSNLMDYKP